MWTTLVACALMGCGQDGCDAVKGDVRRIVPANATGVVVIGPLEETRARATAFLAGIEGASGLLELVSARYGVDLAGPEGLSTVGLDPARGAVLFADKGGFGVGVGVLDPERFSTLLSRRARLLGTVVEPSQKGVWIARPANPSASSACLAWKVTSDGIGLVSAGPDPQWVTASLERMSASDGAFFREPSHRAHRNNGQPALWGHAEWTPAIPLDGLPFLVREAAKKSLASLGAWDLAITVEADKLSVVGRATGTNLPAEWFQVSGNIAAFEKVLPRHLTAAIRLKTAVPDMARAVPSFVLDRLLPNRLPTIDSLPLPSPAQLLDVLNGEVAFAVLGLEDDVLLTQLDPRRQTLEAFMQRVHVAVGLGVRDVVKASDMLRDLAAAAKERGFAVAPVGEDLQDLVGFSLVTRRPLTTRSRRPDRTPRTYAMVLSKRHRALFGITGRGEVARFLNVARGNALPLDGVAHTIPQNNDGEATVHGAVRGAGVHVGAVATPTRIARELADKGVPPYFLKMMSDLFAVAMSIDVAPERVRAKLELQL